jgi:hypothetical protein
MTSTFCGPDPAEPLDSGGAFFAMLEIRLQSFLGLTEQAKTMVSKRGLPVAEESARVLGEGIVDKTLFFLTQLRNDDS